MSSKLNIPQTILRISLDPPLGPTAKAKDLRGCIANIKNGNIFHQHMDRDNFVYRYPLIQYKILPREETPFILGIKDGANALYRLDLLDQYLELGGYQHCVTQQEIITSKQICGSSDYQNNYSFITPWLALNEKNYQKYVCYGQTEKQRALLERLLVGNILSMCKCIGLTVQSKISARINSMEEKITSLKKNPMLGFYCSFSVNFILPDFWGLGKSSARGFGTVKKLQQPH